MTSRIKTHNHMTSIRMPEDWHQWIARFADRWQVPPSYIYRAAIRDFIRRQSQVQG